MDVSGMETDAVWPVLDVDLVLPNTSDLITSNAIPTTIEASDETIRISATARLRAYEINVVRVTDASPMASLLELPPWREMVVFLEYHDSRSIAKESRLPITAVETPS